MVKKRSNVLGMLCLCLLSIAAGAAGTWAVITYLI